MMEKTFQYFNTSNGLLDKPTKEEDKNGTICFGTPKSQ
jgi:hypothetical protein